MCWSHSTLIPDYKDRRLSQETARKPPGKAFARKLDHRNPIRCHTHSPKLPCKGRFRGGPRKPRPPRPYCPGILFLKISALHVQYGIQAFAKFKRPECTRLHLRELQSQTFSRRCMRPNLPRKVRRSQYYISRPPLSQNPPSAPTLCQICTIRFMYLIQFNFQMSLCRLQHGCFLRQILYLFPGSTQLRLKLCCPVLQASAHFALKLKSCWGFGSSVASIGELCA